MCYFLVGIFLFSIDGKMITCDSEMEKRLDNILEAESVPEEDGNWPVTEFSNIADVNPGPPQDENSTNASFENTWAISNKMAVEDLWKQLGEPKFVVAPMVDASELAWRMLCRNHGAELCFTPMLHSSVFARNTRYREESLATCSKDRPLIVQFCGNDPEILLKAASHVDSLCDCIDINLGCPQTIAKRGHYGSFLQDEWELISRIVRTLRQNLRTPISCKVRVYPDISKSVEYAQMLERAGCQLLTIHGRTREQKGPMTGVASWAHIKAMKEAVNIPVIANGNIQYLSHVFQCLNETGCNGVMSAEGILHNPALFEGKPYPVWELALEYLELVDTYPCPLSYTRGHLFKLFQHVFYLPENFDLRDEIAKGQSRSDFLVTTLRLKARYETIHMSNENQNQIWKINAGSYSYNLTQPPWICQPWVRMTPEDHLKKMHEIQNRSEVDSNKTLNEKLVNKRNCEDNSELVGISKKKLKKLQRRTRSTHPHSRQYFTKCLLCPNPVGLKCENELCKTCCRKKCSDDDTSCISHRIKVKKKPLISVGVK